MTKKFFLALCLFILGTFISACGGGGKTTPPSYPFIPVPTPTPTVSPTPEPTVSPTPEKYPIELSQTEFTVNIGETDNITVTLNGEDITQTATYTVDQEAIATVEAGLITGISVGIATVTVHAENAEADKIFTVNVIDPTLPSLEVSPTEVNLIIGEQGAVTVTLEGKDVTEDVTYTVDDKSIATVEKGKITGIDEGTTNVTVSHEGANSTSFTVNVTDDSTPVTLNDEVLGQLGYKKVLVPKTKQYDIKKIEDGTSVKNLEIPVTFQDNENKKCKIIAIGNSAFEHCFSLKSVTIPDSVIHIGNSAFDYCSSLESVTIPDSVIHIGNLAFDHCSSLESVTIGNGLTAIGKIFFHCSKLENVTISDNILCIFPKAFRDCPHLTRLTAKNGTAIDIPKKNGISTSNNVTFIDVKAISDITSVTIPDGVTEIPDNAFTVRDSLESVTIPDSVKTIGEDAFKNCTNSDLTIAIPDDVTTIGEDAFLNVAEITYTSKMKATGTPWGAKKVNGVVQ